MELVVIPSFITHSPTYDISLLFSFLSPSSVVTTLEGSSDSIVFSTTHLDVIKETVVNNW